MMQIDTKTALYAFAIVVAILLIVAAVGYFTGAWEQVPTGG